MSETATPCMAYTGFMGICLAIYAVYHQHVLMVSLKKMGVMCKRCILNRAVWNSLNTLVVGPMINVTVSFWVTKAGGIPAAIGAYAYIKIAAIRGKRGSLGWVSKPGLAC